MSRRELNTAQIEALASTPGVRRLAVENFLSTVDLTMTYREHLMNLNLDRDLYHWNRETIDAIIDGLRLIYDV